MNVRLPYKFALKQAKQQAIEAAAEERARELFRDYDSYTTDIVIISAVLALVEEFGWGYGARATRIPRFIAAVEKTLRDACDRYDHAFAMTALRKRLREYGIEYEGRDGNG
ncbi:MAG: hypothetical protein IJF49_08355 [Clostridia bacterium]|nr:hypothetical protein [Clostridia bacterium]